MILEVAALCVVGGMFASKAKQRYWKGKNQPSKVASTSQERHSSQQEQAEENKIKDVYHGVVEIPTEDQAGKKNSHTLALSSASLGLATAGVVYQPLSLLSAPIIFYLFYPSFKASYHALRKERRLNMSMMDATRITVCLTMGYYFVGALDAWLRSITERVLAKSDEELNDTLTQQFSETPNSMVRLYADGLEQEVPLRELTEGSIIVVKAGDLILVDGTVLHGVAWLEQINLINHNDNEPVQKTRGDDVFASTLVVAGELYIEVTALKELIMALEIQELLQETVEKGTITQKLGEASGNKMRPIMLASFAFAWPLWRDANRAAGFLTTSFGAQMDPLGSHTLKNFVNLGSQQGILIKDGRVFEFAKLINMIIIDASLLQIPAIRSQLQATIAELRERHWPMQNVAQQPFMIYLMADNDHLDMKELISEFGFDDGFVEPLLDHRIQLIQQFQQQGRFVCYIGNGTQHSELMQKSMMSISIGSVANLKEDAAQLLLTDQHLGQLPAFFDMADQFNSKQRFNFAWPLLMDSIDIFTTVFVHFGLVYSVLFAHTGTLISALNAKRPLQSFQREQQPEYTGQVQSNASPEHAKTSFLALRKK